MLKQTKAIDLFIFLSDVLAQGHQMVRTQRVHVCFIGASWCLSVHWSDSVQPWPSPHRCRRAVFLDRLPLHDGLHTLLRSQSSPLSWTAAMATQLSHLAGRTIWNALWDQPSGETANLEPLMKRIALSDFTAVQLKACCQTFAPMNLEISQGYAVISCDPWVRVGLLPGLTLFPWRGQDISWRTHPSILDWTIKAALLYLCQDRMLPLIRNSKSIEKHQNWW